MTKINIRNKRVLIKTFLFESGLWYLAESLKIELESLGNEVAFISKARYSPNSFGRFEPSYPECNDKRILSKNKTYQLNKKSSILSQMQDVCEDYKPDIIISMETLMQNAQWVSHLRNMRSLRVIDIPMLEWVSPKYLKSRSYEIFDEIWCLTDVCKRHFSLYKNSKRIEWDFYDKKLFFKDRKNTSDKIKFFHAASVSKFFSYKNTELTISAFNKFCKAMGPVAELEISGCLTKREKEAALLNPLVKFHDTPISREGVAEAYRRSDCVLAVSKKEGLGLSLFEAKACGCDLITTDSEPMSQHSSYLCKVVAYNKDESLVPASICGEREILEQIIKFYEDKKMGNNSNAKEIQIKAKKKTPKEVEKENSSLLEAFESNEKQEDEVSMDPEVLSNLKNKMSKKKDKEEDEVPEVVDEQNVSINLCVVGVGQAGSRIAEVFHKKGYDVGVVNTSAQDLEFISVMQNQKLLLEGSLGGTGKDLDLGREIFAENAEEVTSFVDGVIEGNDMVYLAVSGGGGTGSSSVDCLIPMLFDTGMPVGVIYVLPKATEDAQSKHNSVETLARLAKMTSSNMISSLVVVDNARIEQIYANLSQSQFWSTANNAIVEPMHVFNTLTSRPSRFTSLDPSDFAKIISCGDCSIYGVMEVDNYTEETALAEAVIESLSGNMLAEGFDVSQTRVGGVIICGPKSALDKLPAININYCFHMISEQTNGASIFQGVYDVESESDSIKIYSWFAGLGLPKDRIDNLRMESKEQAKIAMEKEKLRASAMNLDLEEDKVNNVADEVHRKIQKKKSGFNRLQRGKRSSIIDKRRKR